MRVIALGAILTLTACASANAPPSADTPQQAFPDIGGHAVMLLPVQGIIPAVAPPVGWDSTRAVAGLSGETLRELEAELSYWLPEQAQRTRWVLPDTIDRAVSRSPALGVNVRELPVRDFQHSRIERIGDPLYGDLRRVAALTDARLALLPIGAVWIPEAGGGGRVHVAVALIDTLGGAVLWYGVAAGAPAAQDDPAGVASAARALAAMVPR